MFPFDRLIRAVDDLIADGTVKDRVVAQIGNGRYEPCHCQFERFVEKATYERLVVEATMLIAHAGAGTIGLALQHRKPLLVLPRLRRHHEHVNDHQIATARRFAELGHVIVAENVADLAPKLGELAKFSPRPRTIDTERMAHRIGQFMDQMRWEP